MTINIDYADKRVMLCTDQQNETCTLSGTDYFRSKWNVDIIYDKDHTAAGKQYKYWIHHFGEHYEAILIIIINMAIMKN